MNLLVFFAIIFATIIFAIVLQRIIRNPLLVGLVFFAIFLLVAAILNNIIFVIAAITLGILAFLTASIYCILNRTGFLYNNPCITGDNNRPCNSISERLYTNFGLNNNNSFECGVNKNSLTILNGNGEVIARINGDNVSCGNGVCQSNLALTNQELINTVESNSNSGCGCCNRNYTLKR